MDFFNVVLRDLHIIRIADFRRTDFGIFKILFDQISIKSSCNIGSNLYKATFFKQPGEIYNFVNLSIQGACEVEFYLKLIAEKEILDPSVVITATNKCAYLRKVAERAQLVR